MNAQIGLFEKKTIKDRTLGMLKDGWYSTNQVVQKIGAQSADRCIRTLREEGWKMLERKRRDHIIERHIEG